MQDVFGSLAVGRKAMYDFVSVMLVIFFKQKCAHYDFNYYIEIIGEAEKCEHVSKSTILELSVLVCGQIDLNYIATRNVAVMYALYHNSSNKVSYYTVRSKGVCSRSVLFVSTTPLQLHWTRDGVDYLIYASSKFYEWIVYFTGKIRIYMKVETPKCFLQISYEIAQRYYPVIPMNLVTSKVSNMCTVTFVCV